MSGNFVIIYGFEHDLSIYENRDFKKYFLDPLPSIVYLSKDTSWIKDSEHMLGRGPEYMRDDKDYYIKNSSPNIVIYSDVMKKWKTRQALLKEIRDR